jgi:thiol-disulfide isomerase/thioredoxin
MTHAAARRPLTTLAALALAFGLFATAPRAADRDEVKLESLTFDAFKARLAKAGSQNYKYTLVDAWATTCGPCKENFPHLVDMHHKYAGKGLQVISLSLDDTADRKAVESAREFLREKKATFLNVLLDEEFGVGFERLDINAIPAVFVFGPDGKLVKKYTLDDPNNQFTYDQVEKDVVALLAGKPAASR